MEYSKIIAVSGLQGLFELISSKNDGAIVRSLDDKTTRFVSSRIHNFSHLESIEIYTIRDNVNLVDILLAMQKSDAGLPDTKDNTAVKKYFEAAYPDLDFERVYASDMKKIVKWYEILNSNKIEIKLSEPEAEEPAETETPAAEAAPVKEKPAGDKKASKVAEASKATEEPAEETPKKKAAPKKKETATTGEVAEKPVKKAAAKEPKAEKEEPAEEAPKKKAAAKKK